MASSLRTPVLRSRRWGYRCDGRTFCPSCTATLAPQVTDSILRSLQRVENQRPWNAVPGGVAEREGVGWWAGVCDRIGGASNSVPKGSFGESGGWRSPVSDENLQYQRGTPAAEECGLRVPSRWNIAQPGGVPFATLMLSLAKQSPQETRKRSRILLHG